MRKWVAVLVAVCVLVLLTACGDTAPTAVDKTIERHQIRAYVVEEPTVYTLSKLTEESITVVVADVRAEHYARDLGMTTTTNVVEMTVIETLRGSVKGELLVSDTGIISTGDYIGQEPPPLEEIRKESSLAAEPMMRKGHRVLLFLVENESMTQDGRMVYRTTAGPVCKYFYDPADGLYHNSLEYSDYYQDYSSGGKLDLLSVSLLDDMTPKTLDEIKALIG